MIESPEVADWRQLQQSVCRLLNEIGLTAKEEVILETPRGKVEVDVFAIDEMSVDKIRYIVECKYWATAIPQHVVHSFTTVMHETGANIGFIVSKAGLQAGAERYTNSTNITGLTFEELQQRYFSLWWKNHFCKKIAKIAEKVCFYTEPFNPTRDKALANLSSEQYEKFEKIQRDYCYFAMSMWHADLIVMPDRFEYQAPTSIEEYKEKFKAAGNHLTFKAIFWRELLDEISEKFHEIEKELHKIFGRDIFLED